MQQASEGACQLARTGGSGPRPEGTLELETRLASNGAGGAGGLVCGLWSAAWEACRRRSTHAEQSCSGRNYAADGGRGSELRAGPTRDTRHCFFCVSVPPPSPLCHQPASHVHESEAGRNSDGDGRSHLHDDVLLSCPVLFCAILPAHEAPCPVPIAVAPLMVIKQATYQTDAMHSVRCPPQPPITPPPITSENKTKTDRRTDQRRERAIHGSCP